MDHLTWQTLSSTYLSNHIYFTARRDRCLRQDGVIVDPYFVVELPTAATAFALTENNKVLMVKQYRHPIGIVCLETPGGFVDPGEHFAEAMKRELLEETGYQFPEVEYLGKFAANPGVLNNFTELFFAKGGRKVADQKLDNTEELEVLEFEMEQLPGMIMRQEIQQSVHANCILLAMIKLGHLAFVQAAG